jgi:hypothetical protein
LPRWNPKPARPETGCRRQNEQLTAGRRKNAHWQIHEPDTGFETLGGSHHETEPEITIAGRNRFCVPAGWH